MVAAATAAADGVILVDGSNVLPALGLDRHDDEDRRALVRRVAALARARRTRAVVFFDGSPHSAFAGSLGNVAVRFSGSRSADDLMVETVERSRGEWCVVTRDTELKSRLRRRGVAFAEAEILREMPGTRDDQPAGDWESWFADPSNRMG